MDKETNEAHSYQEALNEMLFPDDPNLINIIILIKNTIYLWSAGINIFALMRFTCIYK